MKRSSRPRKTANPSESVHRQLNMYALAARAAGVSLLALTQPSEARIVYTAAHKVIGLNSSYNLDLNHDGVTDFSFENLWASSADFGPSGVLSILPAQQANGIWGYATRGGFVHYASALRAGVRVGPKGPFISPIFDWMVQGDQTFPCAGPWTDVKNRYLGLKFRIKGEVHFGWARLNVACNPQNFKMTAVLTGYAYETIPNKPIIAGKTKGPELVTVQPGSVGRLALGRK